jgi:glucose/arabinose dehydrogenase
VYEKYVGRVGALAVAFGVTGAVVTSPGVAWADDAPSSVDSSSEAPGADDETSGSSGTQLPTTLTTSGSTAPSTDPMPTVSSTATPAQTGGAPAAPIGSETVTIQDGGVIVRSSGGAHTSDTDDAADDEAKLITQQETKAAPDIQQSGQHPTAGEDVGPSPTPDEPLAGGTHDASLDTAATADPLPTKATGVPPDSAEKTALPARLAADLADASADVGDTNLQSQSAGDTTTTLRLSAAADTVANWTDPIAAAFAALPTPAEVVHQVKTTVTACTCSFINQVLKLVNGAIAQLMAPSPSAPTNPADTPILWTVLAWARRQLDQAVQAFGRTPLGRFVQQVTTEVTQAIIDFGNSPLGREISTQITRALEQCQKSATLPADLERTAVVTGLSEPTDFEFLQDPADPEQIYRILITEKSGAIKVYDPHTGDLTTLMTLPTVTADGERGLVGIEVDPHFWTTGNEGYHAIYVAYTGADNYDRLSKLTLSELLNEADETELLKSTELGNNFHHGGELEFDPQGQYLYWAVGDNTDSPNAQDLTNIHGKILRLNRDGSAPADNPFVDYPNAVEQIYAYGFRNPFRFTFAPDGTLLVGDVGEADWEELNVVTPGANYGWPNAEGACSGCAYVNPIYAYRHSDTPAHAGSITSVVVYTGTALPTDYQDKVFIADYSVGWIKELTFDSNFSSLISERTLDNEAGATVKMAQGPDGNLYQLKIYPGELSVIGPSGGNRAPTAVITASSTYGPGDSLEVQLSSGDSSDPEYDVLTYGWDFGDGRTSKEANPTVVFTNAGDYTAYTVTLTVSDGEKTSNATQRVVVGSTPPTAVITVSDDVYNAGDTISFSASGLDGQDGTLPASAYNWTVEFHHADHIHPFRDNIVGPAGSITIPRTPDQLANTFYRITLTVTDSSGLSTTQFVDVKPNLVALTFDANYPDATFTIDGRPHTGLYTEQAVVGVERVLNAPSQYVDDGQLVFDSWSDGGAQSHTIATPNTNSSYTVTYNVILSTVTALA